MSRSSNLLNEVDAFWCIIVNSQTNELSKDTHDISGNLNRLSIAIDVAHYTGADRQSVAHITPIKYTYVCLAKA